eukprot:gene3158-2140_t
MNQNPPLATPQRTQRLPKHVVTSPATSTTHAPTNPKYANPGTSQNETNNLTPTTRHIKQPTQNQKIPTGLNLKFKPNAQLGKPNTTKQSGHKQLSPSQAQQETLKHTEAFLQYPELSPRTTIKSFKQFHTLQKPRITKSKLPSRGNTMDPRRTRKHKPTNCLKH